MNLPRLVWCNLLVLLACATQTVGAPLELVPGESQLFVDDFLIESHTNLIRTLHQPRKDNGGQVPVLSLDREYGELSATLEANGSVVYDKRLKKYVMFALSYCSQLSAEGRVRLYRFTSSDAMTWTKGDNGQPEEVKFDLVDKTSGRKAAGFDLFCCFYDTRNAAYPYQGWLYYWNWEELEGIYHVQSKDGRTWERGVRVMPFMSREIQKDGRTLRGPADVTIFHRDEANERFLANIKFYSPQPVGPNNYLRSRAYLFVDRIDQAIDVNRITEVNLVPAAAEANGDLPSDEYYASTAWCSGSVWLGGLKVWHREGAYPYSAPGCAFLKLAVSRDGLHWQQVSFPNENGHRSVFIPNGPEGGNDGKNDGGYVTEFSQGPIRVGDEFIYYYGASSWGKNHPGNIRVSGGGIFRARLRPDGFVSINGGSFTTKLFTTPGRELFVNSSGDVEVALLDERGKAFRVTRLKGDSLRHKVLFKGKSLSDVARGKPARLRFTVENGRLYSFTVDGKD